MAKGKFKTSKAKSKRKSKYSDIEKLAFNMGRVKRGLGKDSLVNDSYERGLNPVKKEKPIKKTLFGD